MAVEASLTVTRPPHAAKLYFWALQVGFQNGSIPVGAGHFGLQHHPAYPGSGAVNWGGYHRSSSLGELTGSKPKLDSALNNPNTFNYSWQPHTKYRYRIAAAGDGMWRGSITDLSTGEETIVRDLIVKADSLSAPVVWSEVFADCDAPSTSVEWSDFSAVTARGEYVEPSAVFVSY